MVLDRFSRRQFLSRIAVSGMGALTLPTLFSKRVSDGPEFQL